MELQLVNDRVETVEYLPDMRRDELESLKATLYVMCGLLVIDINAGTGMLTFLRLTDRRLTVGWRVRPNANQRWSLEQAWHMVSRRSRGDVSHEFEGKALPD